MDYVKALKEAVSNFNLPNAVDKAAMVNSITSYRGDGELQTHRKDAVSVLERYYFNRDSDLLKTESVKEQNDDADDADKDKADNVDNADTGKKEEVAEGIENSVIESLIKEMEEDDTNDNDDNDNDENNGDNADNNDNGDDNDVLDVDNEVGEKKSVKKENPLPPKREEEDELSEAFAKFQETLASV